MNEDLFTPDFMPSFCLYSGGCSQVSAFSGGRRQTAKEERAISVTLSWLLLALILIPASTTATGRQIHHRDAAKMVVAGFRIQ